MNKDIEKYINSRLEEFEKGLDKKREEFRLRLNKEVSQMTESKTIWDLDKDYGGFYYYLSANGVIGQGTFNSEYDENIRALGNVFLTKEEVEFEREKDVR